MPSPALPDGAAGLFAGAGAFLSSGTRALGADKACAEAALFAGLAVAYASLDAMKEVSYTSAVISMRELEQWGMGSGPGPKRTCLSPPLLVYI